MIPGSNDPYSSVLKFAETHYENFPVISFLIPAGLRKHIAVIYWFARTADDIADEGILPAGEKLNRLIQFEERFLCTVNGNISEPEDEALFNTIREMKLDPQHFLNLLKAFKQDTIKKRYVSYSELIEYCTNSANPVGRLMLALYGVRDSAVEHYSDQICTALQITNFLQDVDRDFKKGRIYLPQEELAYFGVEEKVFEMRQINGNFKELMKFNVDRTFRLFEQGQHLLPFLNGRFKVEIKWTIAGGEKVLNKIRKIDYNVLSVRPYLTKKDYIYIFIRSLL